MIMLITLFFIIMVLLFAWTIPQEEIDEMQKFFKQHKKT